MRNIRIIDLSERLPGPFCSMVLADLGCEVIKVERPGFGDVARTVTPELFKCINRNKKSIALNLKTTLGRKILRELIKSADVLIEGFRPGTVEKLHIDFERIKRINPKILYCSISGFGQTGPYRNRTGHDINYVGIVGGLSFDRKNINLPPYPIADLSSGIFAAISILAALLSNSNGKAQHIDISMIDSVAYLLGGFLEEFLSSKTTLKLTDIARSGHYGIFETKDKKFISLGIVEEWIWENFCTAIGREDILKNSAYKTLKLRIRNRDKLIAILGPIFRKKTRDEWVKVLNKKEICCAPVNEFDEIFCDPQIRHRETFATIEEPNGLKRKVVRFPARFSLLQVETIRPFPLLGEHTKEILSSLCYTNSEIQALKRMGVIGFC